MPEAPSSPHHTRRPRLVWTLLGAMALLSILPLVVSHYFLIGINRESLETLEKKYLTRSAVSIAGDLQNLLDNNREKLRQIAGSIAITGRALPAGTDPFTYASESQTIGEYITDSGDIVALRAQNVAGDGSEAVPARLDDAVRREMDLAREVALKGRGRRAGS